MQQIRAAVCHAFNEKLKIETVQLAPPGPGEVEVTIDAVAICHSDISFAEGAWGGTLPAVYGHEGAGRITAIGDGVTGYAPGDHVLVTLIRACGTCEPCACGDPTHCATPYDRDNGPLKTAEGSTLSHGLACGAFAEKAVVHHSQIAPYPAEIPAASACLLSCGAITGIGAVVNTARTRPGDVVVVIGAGGVGLNAIQGARIAGAARIIAVDMSEEKLAAARDFGATDGILATEAKPWSAAKKLAGRGADAVFVTVGAIPAYDTAARYLAPGGKLVAVGMPHSGAKSSYEPVILAATGQNMMGSLMGDTILKRDIRWMVDLYQQGRLKLDELVTKTYPLDQINEAIADTKSGRARRNVITF
ncbi:Zn-dependent alcohol dehydrogenase [Acidimangrovimonas sediminis]|uniref:Zn-dependent alcohol dehydrogenase n=1 Tax=Acidimangrovimonas sediminis TaxID=2056283 RepID=UPI000C80A740|nr:Zn-dependent alcohol dehydrogenase [Acidimangrovimonas sediminis]